MKHINEFINTDFIFSEDTLNSYFDNLRIKCSPDGKHYDFYLNDTLILSEDDSTNTFEIFFTINDSIIDRFKQFFIISKKRFELILDLVNKDSLLKDKLTEIYNKTQNKVKITSDKYNIFHHFNYSLAIKEIKNIGSSKDIFKKDKIIHDDKNKKLINLLKNIDIFRRKYFFNFLANILNLVCSNDDYKTNKYDEKKRVCKLNDFGSKNLSSDMDLTILNSNYNNVHEIIDLVNKYFSIYSEKIFLNNLFDINIYFTDWKEVNLISKDMVAKCTLFECKSFEGDFNIQTNKDLKFLYESQLQWATLRLFNNINLMEKTLDISKIFNEVKSILNKQKLFNIIKTYDEKQINILDLKKEYDTKLIPYCDTQDPTIKELIKKI